MARVAKTQGAHRDVKPELPYISHDSALVLVGLELGSRRSKTDSSSQI
jgi:hypothetical protein